LNRAVPQSAEVQPFWTLAQTIFIIVYLSLDAGNVLRGLGELYNTEPEFIAIQETASDLPEYLQAAVKQYVDDLEYAEIKRSCWQRTRNRKPDRQA